MILFYKSSVEVKRINPLQRPALNRRLNTIKKLNKNNRDFLRSLGLKI